MFFNLLVAQEEYPAPINNAVFYTEEKTKLSKDIQEGVDYVWLPVDIAEMLAERYGKVERLLLRMVCCEDVWSPLSLYTYRVDVRHCTKANKYPKDAPGMFLYLSGECSLDEVLDQLMSLFDINTLNHSARLWVREYGERVYNILQDSNNYVFPQDRYLTADYVSWDEVLWHSAI